MKPFCGGFTWIFGAVVLQYHPTSSKFQLADSQSDITLPAQMMMFPPLYFTDVGQLRSFWLIWFLLLWSVEALEAFFSLMQITSS